MTKQSKQLILDANAIFYANKVNVFSTICQVYKVLIPAIILEDEAFYFKSESGRNIGLNTSEWINTGLVLRKEASLADYSKLTSILSDNIINSLDAGEQEAVAILIGNPQSTILFSTGDGLAIKALGILSIGDQGISLEEIFETSGIKLPNREKLPYHFTKKWFKKKLNEGFVERNLWLRR